MEEKEWYKSKTVWSGLVTVVIGLLSAFGLGGSVEGESDNIAELLVSIATVAAGLLTLVGRLMAKSKIKPVGTTTNLFLAFVLFVVLTIGGALVLSGCSEVQMTPRYRAMLKTSSININELNRRCQNGDSVACKDGLEVANETLQLLVDAVNGVYDVDPNGGSI